jgi:hypothetical protein
MLGLSDQFFVKALPTPGVQVSSIPSSLRPLGTMRLPALAAKDEQVNP